MEQFEKVQSVAKRFDIGVSTVWEWVKQGEFPAPVKLSKGCTRWKISELQAYARGEWKKGTTDEM